MPIKFHKFNWYFLTPIRILGAIYQIFNFNVIYRLDIVINALIIFILIADIITFIGFFRWRAFAWYIQMIKLIVIAINLVLQGFNGDPINVKSLIAKVIIAIVFFCLQFVYYKKRKCLFNN
jgi:hypothetical protein